MQIDSERFWKVVDYITTSCPMCAFLRGMLFALAMVLVWMWVA